MVALESLRSTFEEHLDGGGFELSGTPPVLAIPLVPSSVPSEMLRIAVSARTGNLIYYIGSTNDRKRAGLS